MAAPYEFINEMLENYKLILRVILTFRLAVICSVSILKVQKLDEKQTILFRHFVANPYSYASRHKQIYRQPWHLSTKVKALDSDGCKKLSRTV
jgi:uncharacterized protein YxeA